MYCQITEHSGKARYQNSDVWHKKWFAKVTAGSTLCVCACMHVRVCVCVYIRRTCTLWWWDSTMYVLPNSTMYVLPWNQCMFFLVRNFQFLSNLAPSTEQDWFIVTFFWPVGTALVTNFEADSGVMNTVPLSYYTVERTTSQELQFKPVGTVWSNRDFSVFYLFSSKKGSFGSCRN